MTFFKKRKIKLENVNSPPVEPVFMHLLKVHDDRTR